MGDTPVHVPVPELSPSTRAALIVATAHYDDLAFTKLRSPVRDAQDLAAVLGDPAIGGFTVTTVVDQPDSRVRMAIAGFLEDRSPDDTVLVYLSCHGIQDQAGRLYFATTNTVKAQPRVSAVKSTDLLEELDECRARQQILILDCCFSGAFGDGRKGEVDLEGRLVRPGRGRVVMTASRGYEYSFEGKALANTKPAGSVFTTGLVTGLRTGDADTDGDGYVAWDEAFAYAERYVQDTGARQTPQRWLSGGEGGKIILARNPSGQLVVPAPLPDDLASDLTSRSEYVRIGAVNEVARWLDDPNQARVLAAEGALLYVAEHDNPRVAAAARARIEQAPSRATTAQSPKDPVSTTINGNRFKTGVVSGPGVENGAQPSQSDGTGGDRPPETNWQRRELPVSRFLISVSGAAPEILQFFPRDRAKYIAYGSMISATSVLAGLAVYFALRMTLVANFVVSAIIAIMVGLLVMALDRWLIITVPHHHNSMKTLMMFVPRLAFGLVLSVIIAAPILLQIFRPEIDDQMSIMQMQRVVTFNNEVANSSIGVRIKSDQERVSGLVDVISHPSRESATAISVAKSELPNAQHNLEADQRQENALKASFEAANTADTGLPSAISALVSAGTQNGTIGGASILLFLLFTIINLLPVIMKTLLSLGPESAYEKATNYGDEIAGQAAAVMRRRQMERIIGKQEE